MGVLEALPGEGEGEECIDSVSDASALSSTLSDSITVPVPVPAPARGLDPVSPSFLKTLARCPLAALLAISFALNALSLSSLPSNTREGGEEGEGEASGTSKLPGKMARGEGMEESVTAIGAGVMDFATSLRLEEGEGVKGERTLLSA